MHRVIISFLVAFVLLMVVIILSRTSFNNTQQFERQAENSRNVIRLFNKIDAQFRSGIIYTPSYESSAAWDLYALYKKELNEIPASFAPLKPFLNEKPRLAAIVDSLQRITQEIIPMLQQKNMSEIIASESPERIGQIKQVHVLIQEALQLEEDLLAQKRKELHSANRQNNLYTLGLSILAIVIVTITFFQQFFLSKKSRWLEGFLESILNTTQNGIVYLKASREKGKIVDFTIEYANNTVHPLIGADPRTILNKSLDQLDQKGKAELFSRFSGVVETGHPTQFEHLFQNNGLERWLYLSVAKRDDGVTVSFHNISELKRYEEELQKNIAALEQSNRELEEYAYAASHDLQEPLRKIRTFGGILLDSQHKNLDERGKFQLEKILQSTDRMSLLIKDLLSFSSLKEKDVFEPADLNAIFENVLRDLEIMIDQRKAIITHDPLPEIDAIPVQINQLFYNLVNNALKFAKEDVPLRLDVTCRLVKAADVRDVAGLDPLADYYEIIFSDNGIGFNQDYAAQIFGLFKRLNDKNRYTGSGIGLSLCKKVVTNHGGIITANGKEGVGAQFYIYFPVKRKLTQDIVEEME